MRRLLTVVEAASRRGERALERLRRRDRTVLDRKTLRRARKIVEAVQKGGDEALLEWVRKLDGVKVSSVQALALGPPEMEGEGETLPEGFAAALEEAIAAVEGYHRRQLREGFSLIDDGVELTEGRTPLRRVGIYIPGGRASYPSTAVMTVVPARVAGVDEVVVATPPASYHTSSPLRHTLARLGVQEIWGMGGAQAVAALAYGTETIPRVDKIVGPGNVWVTAAKALVAGEVGIDGLAGPTEVVLVADEGADPALVAADLLAQAEHDPLAAAVLVTPSKGLAGRVNRELAAQLPTLATAETAAASLRRFGYAFLVREMDEALALVESLAPEHLQLVGSRAEALTERVRNAGAVFLGQETPEVFGDYLAGPSHVLPTGGRARFASGLGVDDFVRRWHRVRFSREAASRRAEAAASLAEAEGLPAHAASARRRLT